jgi:hypothetical protein
MDWAMAASSRELVSVKVKSRRTPDKRPRYARTGRSWTCSWQQALDAKLLEDRFDGLFHVCTLSQMGFALSPCEKRRQGLLRFLQTLLQTRLSGLSGCDRLDHFRGKLMQ